MEFLPVLFPNFLAIILAFETVIAPLRPDDTLPENFNLNIAVPPVCTVKKDVVLCTCSMNPVEESTHALPFTVCRTADPIGSMEKEVFAFRELKKPVTSILSPAVTVIEAV
jgi:hypothetical protein